METKIELPVFKTAFQIELDDSQFVIVYSKEKEDDYYKQICFWDHENQQLQEISDDCRPAKIQGRMIGWSQIPFYFED